MPPDEDGDIVVRIKGRPKWHMAMHGATLSEALHRLADMLVDDDESASQGDEDR